MNQIWKRGLSLLLALVMLLGMAPMEVLAADAVATAVDGLAWDDTSAEPYVIRVNQGETGSIDKSQLYSLLAEFGSPVTLQGFKYGTGDVSASTQINTSYASGSANLVKDTVYTAWISVRSGLRVNWNQLLTFIVIENEVTDSIELKEPNADNVYEVNVNLYTYAGVREAIIEAAIESLNGGAVDKNNAVIYFNDYNDSILGEWADSSEIKVLSDSTLEDFKASDNQTWIRVNYGTAEAEEITIKLVDTRKEAASVTVDISKLGSYDTSAEFRAAVVEAMVIKDSLGNDITASVSMTVTWGEATFPEAETFTVAITNEGETWLKTTFAAQQISGTINNYPIVWVDGDGNVLQNSAWDYGEMPSYDEAVNGTPTKSPSVSETYTWNGGWTPAVDTVKGEITYTATFDSAVRIYDIHWDTNGDGLVDVTTQVAYGTVPTAPDHADRKEENLSPNGWSPEIVAVSGETSYYAQYSNDIIYTIKFVVDGVEEVQYVNVSRNETVQIPADPDKEDYIFDGWDKTVIENPVEDAVYTALWVYDANDNNVRDELETVKVSVSIHGNGSVALVDNENIQIIDNGDGSWNVLYDSTVAGAEIVEVTATPADTDTTDGAADYLVSCPTSINLKETDLIEAEFATVSISDSVNGSIGINRYNAALLNASEVKNLKTTILTILGIDLADADKYTVTAKVGINSLGSLLTTDAVITDDGATATLPLLGETDVSGILASELSDKSSMVFTITLTSTEEGVPTVTRSVSIPVHDTRPVPEVSASQDTIEFHEKEEVADLVEQVENLFTVLVDGEAVALNANWITWAPNYAWPDDSLTNAFIVTVQVPDGASYQESNAVSVNVIVEDTTILYIVSFDDGVGNTWNVTLPEHTPVDAPADPVRDYYSFAGWYNGDVQYDFSANVESHLELIAKWNAILDNNGNNIADQEELYKVIYVLDNGEEDIVFADLSWGADMPAVENPVREGYNFKGWDVELAATVSAPPSGNTIIYTAQWTQKHVVTFDNDGVLTYVDVEHTMKVAELAVDAREGYDFLGWYLNGELYDFDTAVEGNMTLVAVWREDRNNNDIEDSDEPHYTVVYTDGFGTELFRQENILTGLATPKCDDPAVKGYIFNGWDQPISDTVVADVVYTALWLNDINNNGKNDVLETITVVINGNGTVTIDGTEYANGDTFVFDSVNDGHLVLKATPVTTVSGVKRISSTFVNRVLVGEANAELTYATDFSATNEFDAEGSLTVTVEFLDAGFIFNDVRLLNYYPGMKNVVNDDVYNAIVASPALPGEYTLQYFARPAMTHTVNLSSMGLPDTIMGVLKLMGMETITIDMDDLWLDVEVNDLSEEIENAVSLDQAVSQYLTYDRIVGLYDIYNENGGLKNLVNALKAVTAELDLIIENIKNAALYYGAHSFGYNATDAETVTETIKITYKCEAFYIEDQTTLDLKDLRLPSYMFGNDISVVYRDYTDEDLIELIGAYVANGEGEKIDAILKAMDITDPYTFEGKFVSDTAYELTFKFAGDETYKPCEGTFLITITKAPASIDVPNVNITYGEEYTMLAPEYVTLGNQYGLPEEVLESMIQFVIGLDVADLAVDADGVSGLSTTVQLILPEELQKLLDGVIGITGGDTSDGLEMSLSELTKYLELIPDTSLDALNQALEAISSITEAGNITIVIGGELPTDIGVYLYGAVSTSANYETAFDVAYIVIKPETTQVYLDWNYAATNGVFTWELLEYADLGASAFDDADLTSVNADASGLINNLIFGIDEYGDLIVKLVPAGEALDHSALSNGAYTQLAYIADFGNQLYYAMPIVRAFVIVPDVADVELVDKDGNALDNFTFTYDKTAQKLYVMVDGELVEAEITYAGIRTNTETYGPTTEAPVHAGAYGALAVYVARNEAGEIIAIGVDAATMTIQPAESTIDVTGGTFEYDGMPHGVTVVAPTPDVTLISIYLNYNASVDGLKVEDIAAVMNVSLPQWLEDILAERFPNAYANGITKADLQRELLENADALLEMGVTQEMINSMKNLLKNIPFDMNISFNGIVSYTEPGAYAYIGVVTDSDYIPSYDTGLVVIQKEGQVLDMMDTTVTWNGNGQFIDVYNQPETDYVTIIIDRENNIGNIILEDDLMDLIAILEESLGITIPESIDVGTLQTEIRDVLAQVEAFGDLPAEVTEALNMVYDLLNSLPQDGIIYINGEWLPTNVGQYEFYGASYSAQYATNLTQGILTIVPVEIEIIIDSNEKVYGTEDPERTFTVNYYDHLGNQLSGVAADMIIEILRAEGENVGAYLYTANMTLEDENFKIISVTEDAVLTITPAELTITVADQEKVYGENDPEFTYTIEGLVGEDEVIVSVSREEGENVGTYAINAAASDDNYNITIVPGTLTINKKVLTITVDNQEKIYGNADPELTYTVEGGVIAGDELNVEIFRAEGETVGFYAIIANAENANYDIIINEDAQLEIKKATVTVTVKDQDIYIDSDDQVPAIDADDLTIECDGVVTEEELGLKVYWDVEYLDGEILEGSYIAFAEYNSSENFTVVVNGAATAEDPYVPGENMPRLIVGDEDYVCWNMQTGTYYTDLSDALEANDGEEIETIQMLKNYNEKYVIIAPGTTLDLSKYTVTAKFVVGMTGSYLTGVPYTAQLIVNKNNLSLAEECYNDGAYDILPVYDASINGFRMARFSVNTDANKNRGLTVDEENDTLYFQFVINTTKEIRQLLLADGSSDNELSIVVRLEWNTGNGIAYQDFVYSDEYVSKMFAGGTDLTMTLKGYSALGIDLSTLTVRGMVITNSDAVSSGAIHIA